MSTNKENKNAQQSELKLTKLDHALEGGYNGLFAATPVFAGAALNAAVMANNFSSAAEALTFGALVLGYFASHKLGGQYEKDNFYKLEDRKNDPDLAARSNSYVTAYVATYVAATGMVIGSFLSEGEKTSQDKESEAKEITVEKTSAQVAVKADAKTFVWQPA